MNSYLILGACNPKLAHTAITHEPAIGLLLPCNVVMSKNAQNEVIVSAVDPVAMFEVVHRQDVEPLAQEVRTLLQEFINSL